MKKIIAVIAFFAITILSTDTVFAQESNTKSYATNAKTFAHQLTQECGIDGDQQRAVYHAHMLKERKIFAIKSNNSNQNDALKKITEVKTEFNNKLKSILTTEQYNKHLRKKK